MTQQTPSYDVVVVGAGLSGLTAAHEIVTKHENANVCVLEARDRVGGRLCTVNVDLGDGNDYHCDIGGQWVVKQQEHVMRMLKELKIDTYKQFITGKSILHRRNTVVSYWGIIPYNINWFGLIDLQWALWHIDRMAQTIDTTQPWNHPRAKEWDSMTVETYMNSMWTEVGRDLIRSFCISVYACEPNEVSFLFFLFIIKNAGSIDDLIQTENGAQDSKIDGGAQELPKRLAKRVYDPNILIGKSKCTIEYNSPVQKIEKDENGYLITTRSEKQVRAKYIIMAIPPTLSSRIQYNPPLPSLRDQLCQRYPMGYVIKTNAFFKSAFWRTDNFCGFFASSSNDIKKYPVIMGFDGTSINALVGFISANSARYWSSKSKNERIEATLAQYAELFGKSIDFIKEQFLEFVEQDWGLEEFSRGAYMGVMGPGALTTCGEAIRIPIDNMHFAGTETATVWNGYMSGAIQAGERAATEVIEKMK